MTSAADDIRILTVRRRLADARTDLAAGTETVEAGYADLAETLLACAHSLRDQAKAADFSPPPYPPARRREIELTLSQTREMKFRVGPPGEGP